MGILWRSWTGRLVAIGALLSAFLAAGYFWERAVSEDPGVCERYANDSEIREQIVHGVETGQTVAVVGDSYSAGLLLDDVGASWPSQLPGEVHVFGFSGSGFAANSSPCPGVSYAERAAEALRVAPQLVVVQGGLNDTDRTDAEVKQGVRRLLARLDGREVVLVGPPAAPSRPDAARIDDLLAEAAERAGVHYVRTQDAEFDYLPGDLHLTPEGHREFGQLVAEELPG